MKLGIGAVSFGPKVQLNMDLLLRAEELGFDSAWTAEAWGNDAVTTASWALAQTSKIKVGTAIMQMPARQPAMAAMTAMSLDHLSGGRFILGLGPSGPQVAEGWYGVPYGKPLTRTREYINIIRQVWAREAPVRFEGEYYTIPASGPGSTGLGKPLKSIVHGNPDIPIYTASISPNGLRCSGEVADGVFPMMLDPETVDHAYLPFIEEGFSKAEGEKSLANFDICPFVTCIMSDDIEGARAPIKHNMALYIGGMGAREKNFYNNYAKALGFEDAAVEIQDHFLSGRRDEAMAAVPAELIDACHLVGPADRIRERLARWKTAGEAGQVHNMLIGTQQPEALELIASEML